MSGHRARLGVGRRLDWLLWATLGASVPFVAAARRHGTLVVPAIGGGAFAGVPNAPRGAAVVIAVVRISPRCHGYLREYRFGPVGLDLTERRCQRGRSFDPRCLGYLREYRCRCVGLNLTERCCHRGRSFDPRCHGYLRGCHCRAVGLDLTSKLPFCPSRGSGSCVFLYIRAFAQREVR